MPKNKVTDLITDQEMAFARLVLNGTMTDRDAAEAAGLNPDTAAYTKSKPRVRAYMLEYRAAVQQQLVDQETDLSRRAAEEQRRKNQWRQKVLDRLWEIAALPAEVTRGSITGQVKAISMIVAIEGLIPDRRAGSSQKKSDPPLPQVEIDPAAWVHDQQATTVAPQPSPAPVQQEDEPGVPEPNPAPGPVADPPPDPAPNRSTPSQDPEPYVPMFTPASDTRLPFSIKKNRFGRHP